MALITCPACGKQISDRAVSCPHCGEPIQGQEPMMEYQQQEPVQQYDESGDNNNRKYIAPLAIFAGVLLAVLVGVIAYNKGVGTPVYFGNPNGTVLSFLQRLFYSYPGNLKMMPLNLPKKPLRTCLAFQDIAATITAHPGHTIPPLTK